MIATIGTIQNPETGEIRNVLEQSVEPYGGPAGYSIGPRKVFRALCADGEQRTATCSPNGADTFFSIPARVRARGKTVSGYVTRETLDGFDTETEDDPAVWRFIAYRYRKNAGAIPNTFRSL